jgi:hypothetical protein
MQRRDQTKELLKNIESVTGKKVQWAVSSLQSGVGDVQVNVYPATGDAYVSVFSLLHGLTARSRELNLQLV